MAAHLKKRVYEEFTKVVQQQQEEVATKKLRLTKPSKSAALHIDLCKATSPADALQYLLQFARKPVEAESVEGVVRILSEHYYKENDPSVRLKIASLLGLLSKTAGFSPDCIMDDAINILQNKSDSRVCFDRKASQRSEYERPATKSRRATGSPCWTKKDLLLFLALARSL
uniref:Uncharacterized protein n=1 Tax=Rangifer tarandus platyrhynchus TaxID=3082113 RepID=A0ACB0EW66_RANTA|nr:unnamed protein product [Rangifer tarandus platyrhynchus]